MTELPTPDDFENNENLEKHNNPEEIVLARKEFTEINSKTAALPGIPLLDYSRERVEGNENEKGLEDYLDISPDYSNFQMEDLTYVLQSIENRTEDTLTPVLEKDFKNDEGELNDVFAEIVDELQSAHDPSNILFGRFVTFSKNFDKFDAETEVKLAKAADKAGMDVYVAMPLTLQDQPFTESLEEYIEKMKELAEETDDSLKIVPVLHLVSMDYPAGKKFAKKVEANLPEERFKFIGVTGSPIYTNQDAFTGVRDNSERKLLVSNCDRKVNQHQYEKVNKMSLQELYQIRGAPVVLQKRSISGGGDEDNQIELRDTNDYYFNPTSVKNAESPLADQVSIQDNEKLLLRRNNVKLKLEGFINEVSVGHRSARLRERLEGNLQDTYKNKPYLENALHELLNPQ